MYDELHALLGYKFRDDGLLSQAFCHVSYQNENPQVVLTSNETLEFLGDAVLQLIVSEYLIEVYPEDSEGTLSQKRAHLVNEESLANLALKMGLPSLLKFGKGELASGGSAKPRLLACGCEAVFGAIFQDGGYSMARDAIRRIFAEKIHALVTQPLIDAKTELQTLVQEKLRITPGYRLDRSEGPDHDKRFQVSVWVGEQMLAVGRGKNKKSAEQEAARGALQTWSNIGEVTSGK